MNRPYEVGTPSPPVGAGALDRPKASLAGGGGERSEPEGVCRPAEPLSPSAVALGTSPEGGSPWLAPSGAEHAGR